MAKVGVFKYVPIISQKWIFMLLQSCQILLKVCLHLNSLRWETIFTNTTTTALILGEFIEYWCRGKENCLWKIQFFAHFYWQNAKVALCWFFMHKMQTGLCIPKSIPKKMLQFNRSKSYEMERMFLLLIFTTVYRCQFLRNLIWYAKTPYHFAEIRF